MMKEIIKHFDSTYNFNVCDKRLNLIPTFRDYLPRKNNVSSGRKVMKKLLLKRDLDSCTLLKYNYYLATYYRMFTVIAIPDFYKFKNFNTRSTKKELKKSTMYLTKTLPLFFNA